MSKTMVEVNNVSMMFNRSVERVDNIKEYLIKLVNRRLLFEEFWALSHVSCQIEQGEAWGIVGLNGSGKSTLLKLIAQVMKPTEGNVSVYGSIAPLIELGAGFDMDLSARENIFLNGAVLGFSRSDMRAKFEEILDFAGLWEFVDVPLKNYSSGMIARLGFSVATVNTPDILIVDEILGVGDYKFQEKCHERMGRIMDSGATIIFVSHSVEDVLKICKKVIWLEKGCVRMQGDAADVCRQYMEQG